MNNQFDRAIIFATANKLIRKGRSRSEAFGMAWAKAKNKKPEMFSIRYKCFMCGGTHEVTAKSAVFLGIANVGLIAFLVLKLTGRL